MEPAPSVCVGFGSTMAQSKRLNESDPMTIYIMNDIDLCNGSKSFGRMTIIVPLWETWLFDSYLHQFLSDLGQMRGHSNRWNRNMPYSNSWMLSYSCYLFGMWQSRRRIVKIVPMGDERTEGKTKTRSLLGDNTQFRNRRNDTHQE